MLNTIKSALNSNLRGISLISNNIANSNTTAFKKVMQIFQIFILQQLILVQILLLAWELLMMTLGKQMQQGALKATGGA